MPTAELTAFLESTLPGQIRAERALHNGDLTPRLSTWSHHDSVTLFGAGVPFCSGWTDVLAVFDWLAATFTACVDYDFELIAAHADGDLAYTVGVERYKATTSSWSRLLHRRRVLHQREGSPQGGAGGVPDGMKELMSEFEGIGETEYFDLTDPKLR